MKVLVEKSDTITRGSVCGIGSFDGVHRGHREIITSLKKLAENKGTVGLITFIPLPFFVLTSAPIICLTLRQEKERLFGELGVDFVYYFKFTKKLARLTPGEFVEVVAQRIKPAHLVVGDNFHFGMDRSGSAKLLQDLAHDRFTVHVVSRVKDEGTISSTRIRELLLLGQIKAANNLLGRHYSITGRVIKGKGKGVKLGFPTLNLKPSSRKLLPLDGVYKANAVIQGRKFRGALFLQHDLVEVHVLGFTEEYYQKHVTVELLERIRAARKFPSDDALRRAIQHDIDLIRQ